MTIVRTNSQGQRLTAYSRSVLDRLVLPLLFIARVQLFILSSQTETYFAWTFAAPISAAFIGARSRDWAFVRTSMGASLTGTGMLAVATFLHLDKFHLSSPLLITRFVTWVWIAVYIFVPLILAMAWITQSRLPVARARAETPLPAWMRNGFLLLAAFTLVCGLGLLHSLPGSRLAHHWSKPACQPKIESPGNVPLKTSHCKI